MRFEFGKNWKSFVKTLTPEMVAESKAAIVKSFQKSSFAGHRVLDIGSGSGLSSLAFLELGADVVAFDYDIDSVESTKSLLQAKAPNNSNWSALQGSVLDSDFMDSLGKFDIVYSWGVLHHTGALWKAVDAAQSVVQPNGMLLVALYNDQGLASALWKGIKWTYCSSALGRLIVRSIFYPVFAAYSIAQDIKNGNPLLTHSRNYKSNRGMSIIHDWDDWLGGYPFEVASPDAVQSYLASHDFLLTRQRTTRGLGCNEFLFTKM